jgi:hypothetical protein
MSMNRRIVSEGRQATGTAQNAIQPVQANATALRERDATAGVPPTPVQPAFIRYPRPGQLDPLSGLSRTQLWTMVRERRVRSVSLKQPGRQRSIRLIDTQSLIAAINRSAA